MANMSSSTGGSHPNRPYYTPSNDSTSFVATAPRFSSNSSASTNAGTQRSLSHPAPLSPPASNRYSSFSAGDDGGDPSNGTFGGQLSDATKALLLSAAFQYTSTCLAMPFEVGKLLLQIQWVPKDEVWIAFGEMERADEMKQLRSSRAIRSEATRRAHAEEQQAIGRNEWNEGDEDGDEGSVQSEKDDWEEEDDDDEQDSRPDFGGEKDELSDEEEAEAYFRDLSNTSSRPSNLDRSTGKKRRRQTDSYGYVMRRSIHEDTARPEFVMPVVVRGGVWEMIKAVGRGKEGWLGLWKGEFQRGCQGEKRLD
jgi:fusion and transport protein UGO1